GDLANLPMAHLENQHAFQNKTGKFIKPTPESGAAALSKIPDKQYDNLHIDLPDPDGEDAYPIVTCTWLLCAQHYDDARKAAELKNVIRYALGDEGQKIG